MILVLNFVHFHLDQPHAVWVVSEPAADGWGYHQLEVVVPASGIAMVMAAENFSYATRVELREHFFSQLNLDVKVLFDLVWGLQEPGDVLEYDGVNGAKVLGLLQLSVKPSIMFLGQVLWKVKALTGGF